MSEWKYYRSSSSIIRNIPSNTGHRIKGDVVQCFVMADEFHPVEGWLTIKTSPFSVIFSCALVPTEHEAIHGYPDHDNAPVSDNVDTDALDAVFTAQRHTDHQNALLAGFTRAALTGLMATGEYIADPGSSAGRHAVVFGVSALHAFNNVVADMETTPCPTVQE